MITIKIRFAKKYHVRDATKCLPLLVTDWKKTDDRCGITGGIAPVIFGKNFDQSNHQVKNIDGKGSQSPGQCTSDRKMGPCIFIWTKYWHTASGCVPTCCTIVCIHHAQSGPHLFTTKVLSYEILWILHEGNVWSENSIAIHIYKTVEYFNALHVSFYEICSW